MTNQADNQLKMLMDRILCDGTDKDTRTGKVRSIFNHNMKFDLTKGFPAVSSKRLAWKSVVGELILFLSKKNDLSTLRAYTYGEDQRDNFDKWTIWTDDAERWGGDNFQMLGRSYPYQWRNFTGIGYDDEVGEYVEGTVDQIENLIHRLKNEPNRRDHIVTAWNPHDIENNLMALKACHVMFQCYVDGEYLDLDYTQRSVDTFLGL